jgi:hypothetical protein
MKIFTLADIPDALGHAWLQHLRDFDAKQPGCHFEVMAEAPDIPFADMVHMLTVNPSLSVLEVMKRGKAIEEMNLRERIALSPDFTPLERDTILNALNAVTRAE